MKDEEGFTLVELMIVITIIGLLAAIAIPNYNDYAKKSYDRACLLEVKGYANSVYYAFNIEDQSALVPRPSNGACESTTDASTWPTIQSEIRAIPKGNGSKIIICHLVQGANCSLQAIN